MLILNIYKLGVDLMKKLTGIYLTLETLKKLKIYAAKQLLSVSAIVEEAVKEYLSRREK